jgi:hypothetical protein
MYCGIACMASVCVILDCSEQWCAFCEEKRKPSPGVRAEGRECDTCRESICDKHWLSTTSCPYCSRTICKPCTLRPKGICTACNVAACDQCVSTGKYELMQRNWYRAAPLIAFTRANRTSAIVSSIGPLLDVIARFATPRDMTVDKGLSKLSLSVRS